MSEAPMASMASIHNLVEENGDLKAKNAELTARVARLESDLLALTSLLRMSSASAAAAEGLTITAGLPAVTAPAAPGGPRGSGTYSPTASPPPGDRLVRTLSPAGSSPPAASPPASVSGGGVGGGGGGGGIARAEVVVFWDFENVPMKPEYSATAHITAIRQFTDRLAPESNIEVRRPPLPCTHS